MLQIFHGNAQPLNRVRVPLREFVRTSILHGEPETDENIRRAVNEMVGQWDEVFNVAANTAQVQMRPDIDFAATMGNFYRARFLQFFRLILNESPDLDNTFGTELHSQMRNVSTHLVYLFERK